MATTFTKGKALGDLLKWETHPMYCRESSKVKNGQAGACALTDALAYPVKADGTGYQLAIAGDEANVLGLIFLKGPLDIAAGATTTFPLALLVRGPAVLNKAALAAKDIAAANFTIATLVTRLKALNFVIRDEPTVTQTQTD